MRIMWNDDVCIVIFAIFASDNSNTTYTMSQNKPYTSISVSKETFEMLNSIKSCFQLKKKKNVTYNEIIRDYVMAGLEAKEPKLVRILALITETEDEGGDAVAEEPSAVPSENNTESEL